MLHKISDFCKEIHNVNEQAKALYKAKYEDKLPREQINNLVEQIQFRLYMLSNDKGEYKK